MPVRPPGHEATDAAPSARRAGRHLAALLALVLAGCSGGSSAQGPSVDAAPASVDPTPTAPTTTTTPAPTTTAPPVPPLEPWTASPAEPDPAAKELATRVVEAIGTYPVGGGTEEAARARLEAAGLPPDLAGTSAGLLVPDAASVADVVYPQLGGLTTSGASIMVVVRLEVAGPDRPPTSVTRTVDVRLARDVGPWQVVEVASDGGAPPEAPVQPSPEVAAVLDDPRIHLPDTAAWDLLAGGVDPRVPQLLTLLAEQHELGVVVVTTGHPTNVFGTDRVSNHTVGRAVDIWAVDGVPIIDQQRSPALEAIVATALAFGTSEIGAPFDTDGPGGRVFTNTVHLDHLHLGFDAS